MKEKSLNYGHCKLKFVRGEEGQYSVKNILPTFEEG
jgi:hypothetical protein